VNQYNLLHNNVPFGGKKQSGIGVSFPCEKHEAGLLNVPAGRELGSYALDEYTSVKAVHWNFGEKLAWPF